MDTKQQLEQALGFGLETGGRRLGELSCSPVTTQEGLQVYLEINGAVVTIEQAKQIRTILLLRPTWTRRDVKRRRDS